MLTSQFFGRLTSNPEIKYLPSGTAMATVSIAVNDDYQDKKNGGNWVKRSYFFDLKLWAKTAERAAEKYHKGMMVYVEAKPTQERWEDQQGQKRSKVVFDVRHIEDIERFGRKSQGGAQPQANDYKRPTAQAPTAPDDFDDDMIPF